MKEDPLQRDASCFFRWIIRWENNKKYSWVVKLDTISRGEKQEMLGSSDEKWWADRNGICRRASAMCQHSRSILVLLVTAVKPINMFALQHLESRLGFTFLGDVTCVWRSLKSMYSIIIHQQPDFVCPCFLWSWASLPAKFQSLSRQGPTMTLPKQRIWGGGAKLGPVEPAWQTR